ncbi:MAG: FG-GAP repeat domain-containing protein [Planktomarina sp.]
MRALALILALCTAGPALSQTITSAEYIKPTDVYPHGILGDAIEHKSFRATLSTGGTITVNWGPNIVFEDTAPRLIDMDGDRRPEVVVVETHVDRGARLSVWALAPTNAGSNKLVRTASTPFIGRRFRWLAPIGATDLDGDGVIEVAYIDRPHLAKTLRVWRYVPQTDAGPVLEDGASLTEVASLAGLTNHRIGERDIAGGIRNCGNGPEMITANTDWSHIMATTYQNDQLKTRAIAPHQSRADFTTALNCP